MIINYHLRCDGSLLPARTMWLYRGAQSVVFYYSTCTPCANSIDRRKRRKDAARSKRDQEKANAIVTDQPRPFAQPTPFSTNKGWTEEITLGPGPPARRWGSRNNVNRVGSWNTASSMGSDSRIGGPSQKKDKARERWNWMRYQREDEPLWGEDVDVKGSSVGFSGRTRGNVDGSSSNYYIARVPPVNDLHPPIVSGPKSRAETRWMLQPPPSAKVMAGKERFSSGRGSPCDSSPVSDEENGVDPSRKPTATSSAQRKHLSPNLLPSLNPETKSPKPHVTVSSDDRLRKLPSNENNLKLPRPPPPSLPADYKGELAFGRDESSFVIAPPGISRSPSLSTISTSMDSEGRSPSSPWHLPDTPISRPVSKSAVDSGRPHRPPISKTLSTVHRDTKNIHLLHLEISDDSHDEVGLGKLEQIRPWRWSMDI